MSTIAYYLLSKREPISLSPDSSHTIAIPLKIRTNGVVKRLMVLYGMLKIRSSEE